MLATLAAAFAVVAVVGVVLWLRDDGPAARTDPASPASQALLRVGDRVARAGVPVLPAGQFHYVHARDYAQARTTPGAVSNGSTPEWALEREQELWIGADGTGRSLDVRAIAPGVPAGTPGDTFLGARQVAVPDLAAARIVRDDRWQEGTPLAGNGETLWAGDRALGSAGGLQGSPTDFAGTPEGSTLEAWGVTTEEIADLPASGRDLDDAVAALITTAAERSPGFDVAGRPATLQDAAREQYEVDTAVRMLGNAPLSGAARRAVFGWLADVPDAALDERATDRLGRTGMQITFSQDTSNRVQARSLSPAAAAAELREATPGLEVREGRSALDMPAHTLSRSWKLSVIVDPDSGQLLQATRVEREQTPAWAVVGVPVEGAVHEARVEDQRGTTASAVIRVWVERAVASTTSPHQRFCVSQPARCG